MILAIWAVIAIVVLISGVLILAEHEWGYALGLSTAAIVMVSYFTSELIVRSPLAVLLPQGSNSSTFDTMAIAAGLLLVLALIVIAYLAGRRSASDRKR